MCILQRFLLEFLCSITHFSAPLSLNSLEKLAILIVVGIVYSGMKTRKERK